MDPPFVNALRVCKQDLVHSEVLALLVRLRP